MSQHAKPIPPDFVGAEAALRRAVARALALARQTGTHCYVWQDGKIVDLAAEKEEAAGHVAEAIAEKWGGRGKDSPDG